MSSNTMEEPLPLAKYPWGSSSDSTEETTTTNDAQPLQFSSRSPFITEEQKDIEYFYTFANVIVELGSSFDVVNLQSENLQLKQKIEQMTVHKNDLEQKIRSMEKDKQDIINQSIEFVKDKRMEYAEQARNYVAKIMVDRDKQKDELLKLQQKNQEAETKLSKKKSKIKDLKTQLDSLQKIQSTITQHGFNHDFTTTTTPETSLPQTPNPTPRLSIMRTSSSSDSDNNNSIPSSSSSPARSRLSEKIPMDSPTMYQYHLLQERIRFYEEKFQEYTNIMIATKTSMDQMKSSNGKFLSFVENFDKFGALLETTSTKNGHLVKQGQKVKNWKQRFFILKDNFLFYYSPQKGVEPLGVVMLFNQVVEEVPKNTFGKEFCFRLTSLGKDYFYCASTENERQHWMDSLKNPKKWWENWAV